MESLEMLIQTLDYTLDTKKKRHIIGGILLSVSLMFGGLAVTTLTLREEGNDE